MTKTVSAAKLALLIGAAAGLAGCVSGVPSNRTLYSENQPVVTRTNYVFDVMTSSAGVPFSEQQRLAGWWDAMALGYGDRVSVDFSKIGPAARDDLVALASREGIILGDTAPVTEGQAGPGVARVVVTRSTASVPDCPNWDNDTDANPNNATSRGYGCSVNTNLAAMIANPEDLLAGQVGSSETVVTTSTKAIQTYRDKANTGAGALKAVASDSN